jgi:flavin-dependent dehydrogenase
VRVLVVGAGVAGATLAQLLRRAGLHPVLVERRTPDADPGYMLGLMPLVDPALRCLGVQQAYRQRSVPVRRYALRDRAGRPLREYTPDGLLAFGDYRGIERGRLLAALATAGAPVTHGATVPGLEQSADGVRAEVEQHRSHVGDRGPEARRRGPSCPTVGRDRRPRRGTATGRGAPPVRRDGAIVRRCSGASQLSPSQGERTPVDS